MKRGRGNFAHLFTAIMYARLRKITGTWGKGEEEERVSREMAALYMKKREKIVKCCAFSCIRTSVVCTC